MKVFLSWSGDLSHKVALVLRDWLPSVIQAVRPYVSSEDIDKGARWSTDIAQELEESAFGIICVTRENLNAPWVNFEAGALSKTIDKSFVSPFLVNIKRSEIQGPLLQFQSTINEKDDVAKLLASINTRFPENDRLTEVQLTKAFDVWWPELRKSLDSLIKEQGGSDKKPAAIERESRKSDALLEEILELVRSQQRLLRSPEDLLPPDYLREMLGVERLGVTPRIEADLDSLLNQLLKVRLVIVSAVGEDPQNARIRAISEAFREATDMARKIQDYIAALRKNEQSRLGWRNVEMGLLSIGKGLSRNE